MVWLLYSIENCLNMNARSISTEQAKLLIFESISGSDWVTQFARWILFWRISIFNFLARCMVWMPRSTEDCLKYRKTMPVQDRQYIGICNFFLQRLGEPIAYVLAYFGEKAAYIFPYYLSRLLIFRRHLTKKIR